MDVCNIIIIIIILQTPLSRAYNRRRRAPAAGAACANGIAVAGRNALAAHRGLLSRGVAPVPDRRSRTRRRPTHIWFPLYIYIYVYTRPRARTHNRTIRSYKVFIIILSHARAGARARIIYYIIINDRDRLISLVRIYTILLSLYASYARHTAPYAHTTRPFCPPSARSPDRSV